MSLDPLTPDGLSLHRWERVTPSSVEERDGWQVERVGWSFTVRTSSLFLFRETKDGVQEILGVWFKFVVQLDQTCYFVTWTILIPYSLGYLLKVKFSPVFLIRYELSLLTGKIGPLQSGYPSTNYPKPCPSVALYRCSKTSTLRTPVDLGPRSFTSTVRLMITIDVTCMTIVSRVSRTPVPSPFPLCTLKRRVGVLRGETGCSPPRTRIYRK